MEERKEWVTPKIEELEIKETETKNAGGFESGISYNQFV